MSEREDYEKSYGEFNAPTPSAGSVCPTCGSIKRSIPSECYHQNSKFLEKCTDPWHSAAMKAIPISAARRIAEEYDYSQVIIIARKVGADGGEHCTTYGVDKANCDVAARIGDFLKFKVMGWTSEVTR